MSQIISFDTVAVTAAALTAAAAGPVLVDYLHNAWTEAGQDMENIETENFFQYLEKSLLQATMYAEEICATEAEVILRAKYLNALSRSITRLSTLVVKATAPCGSDVLICALDLYQPFARLGVVIRRHADHALGRPVAA